MICAESDTGDFSDSPQCPGGTCCLPETGFKSPPRVAVCFIMALYAYPTY
jgi:hypothetical protein